ncbi:MAG: GTPase HflX [Lachnospiraceae bacterium]|nr:GTPase HflX [Lachnospiraceae bacterium]
MIELHGEEERVILAAVSTGDPEAAERSLDELAELARTAGAKVVGRLIQQRDSIHPVTYLGKGKLEELQGAVWELDATGVICDDELTPAQHRSMADAVDCKIMDRTLLILDIFAGRAHTSEGKLQVELAQLKYRATHLTGMGQALSRLGGGIGTRGPGEKKLEIDRRRIHQRIGQLKKELKDLTRHREVARKKRSQAGKPAISLVGYTNAGKSTLFQKLTGEQTYTDDLLFATLDPLTRTGYLGEGRTALFTDTVGFIEKLPHHLVDAFRSTLEEALQADILLHVVDASNPACAEQTFAVYETLRELGSLDKPVVTVFNKADRCEPGQIHRDFQAEASLTISALTGQGIEDLRALLLELTRKESDLPRTEGF